MINAITSLKIPKSASKGSEMKSHDSVSKPSNVKAITKTASSCDKKIGLKVSASDGNIHSQSCKDPQLPQSSQSKTPSQSSSSRVKLNGTISRIPQGGTKCKSTAVIPLTQISSNNKNKDLIQINQNKTRSRGELNEIFPSSSYSSRWWEVLLPLKKDVLNEQRLTEKQNYVTENQLRGHECNVKKPKNITREFKTKSKEVNAKSVKTRENLLLRNSDQ